MYAAKITNKSFHHRIREGGGHYFDVDHLMGINPFDKTKFTGRYQLQQKPKKKASKSKPA